MKKLLIITGIIILVIIAYFIGSVAGKMNLKTNSGQAVYMEDVDLSPEMFIPGFTEIHTIVKKEYTHWESKRLDPDSLFRKYAERIQTISTKEAYGNLLLEYFAELKNGHSYLSFMKYYIDGTAKLVENHIFISGVGTKLKNMGIREKDEILAVDRIPVFEWLVQRQKYMDASTDADRLNRSVRSIFSSYTDGERTFLVKTPDGEKEFTLTFDRDPEIVTSSIIRDSIGYIAINTMMGNVVTDFKKAFDKVQTKPVLIIDIRANGGGNSGNSEQITQYLIRDKQKACVSKATLLPEANHYGGKLIVLIGTSTFSAAESFALDLKESGNAIFIGSPTGGDTGNGPQKFTTRHNLSFWIPVRKPAGISPKGFPMEGMGIEPDYVICQTAEDYLKGVDTVLEYAVELKANHN